MTIPLRPLGTRQALVVSLAIHLGLILYAHHVDTHPERFGGLKYTDVDWRVVTDGAKLIFHGGHDPSSRAQGWLVRRFGLRIGDPYKRQTFRYTPLLPLVLSPALIHPLLGKVVLSLLSLCIPLLLLEPPTPASKLATHLLWTFNPLVINITTRGSPEAIVLLLVVATFTFLRKAVPRVHRTSSELLGNAFKWELYAGLFYALAISWKIYPVIYAPAIWAHLSCHHGRFGWAIWRFGIVTLVCLLIVNVPLWAIWGDPFLEHTFFYHLHRLDHRHNFSPYYYPIYLSSFSSSDCPSSSASGLVDKVMMIALNAIRSPLASFIPQIGLVTLVGFYLTPRVGLDFAVFLQTVVFVVFNKVCTSQYFTWFIPLIPPILPRLQVSPRKAAILLGAWIAAQALWLGRAYQLEFLAQSVHFELWNQGIVLFGVSCWVLGEVLDSLRMPING